MKDGGAKRAPSKKPCRFFHQNDCFRGDKCHMVHAPKAELAPCQTHQFWMEDPWTRPPCEWEERCARSHLDYTGPKEPELLRTNIALQTENSQLPRVRAYATEVLGAGGAALDTGIARSGTSRYRQKLALLEAKDPAEFSRRCVADPTLCRSLLRVYILGGGVCTSLERVGKQVSGEVAAGKCVISAADGLKEEGAGMVGPLRVRVQALPKVMERQLVDENSSFWDDNFPGLVRERQTGVFTHVLSVIFVRGAFLYGLAEAATHGRSIIDNNNEDSPVCRAFYKIKEVTSRAGISYNAQWTAIDIGASPGGWTSYLASRCRRVLSVDPAELDPAVLALPNVIHVQQMIHAAHGRLLELLATAWPEDGVGVGNANSSHDLVATPVARAGGFNAVRHPAAESMEPPIAPVVADSGVPAEQAAAPVLVPVPAVAAKGAATAADLLVSDMNAEPQVVADVLLSSMVAGLAKPGALVIATLKDFCGKRKKMRKEVAMALSRLKVGSVATDDPNALVSDKDSSVDTQEEAAVSRSCVEAGGVGECDAGEGKGYCWRLEGIETLHLLAGAQSEVTIVARAARGAVSAGRVSALEANIPDSCGIVEGSDVDLCVP